MIGNLRILDAPEFLPSLKKVLQRAVDGLLPGQGFVASFTPAEFSESRVNWRLRMRDKTNTLSLHLDGLRSVLIECHDRDTFEACLGALPQFLEGEDPKTGRSIRMNTSNVDVTLFYHDNDTERVSSYLPR